MSGLFAEGRKILLGGGIGRAHREQAADGGRRAACGWHAAPAADRAGRWRRIQRSQSWHALIPRENPDRRAPSTRGRRRAHFAASEVGPRRSVAIDSEPSGLAIRPRRWSEPSAVMIAWPAIGVRHEPSSACKKARSAHERSRSVHGGWRPAARECAVVARALDADRALADGGQHLVDPDRRADMAETEPLQSGERQQCRVDVAVPRACAAASSTLPRRRRSQIRPALEQLAWRRSEAVPTMAPFGRSAIAPTSPADERVAGILARQEGRDRKAVRQRGRHVLGECTAKSIRPSQQRVLDFLGEQALAAGLRQRPVLDRVAGGLDDHDLDARRARRARAAHAPPASACAYQACLVSASLLPLRADPHGRTTA